MSLVTLGKSTRLVRESLLYVGLLRGTKQLANLQEKAILLALQLQTAVRHLGPLPEGQPLRYSLSLMESTRQEMHPLDSRPNRQLLPRGVPLLEDPTLLFARNHLVQKLVIRSVTQQAWRDDLTVQFRGLRWRNIAQSVALVPDLVAAVMVVQ